MTNKNSDNFTVKKMNVLLKLKYFIFQIILII